MERDVDGVEGRTIEAESDTWDRKDGLQHSVKRRRWRAVGRITLGDAE